MYILNAFSLQMVEANHYNVRVREIPTPSMDELQKLESAIGHSDTANVLGVKCNRINVKLHSGDRAIVAQLQGGRLPEGSTVLPDGFSFKFMEIEIE